jgi:hypothetical protein
MKASRLVCVLLAIPVFACAEATPSAPDLLHTALAAMGGEAKIRRLNTLHFQAMGQRNELEQSERPEGPYVVENDQIEEWRDLAHGSWKKTTKIHVAPLPEFLRTVVVSHGAASLSSDGRPVPASGDQLQEAEETLALSPERVLIAGLASPNLHRLSDLTLQNVAHQAVEFTWHGTPVRIYLNADTHLPTAVEWVRAYPFSTFWSVWGDVTTRVYYSFWWLQNGIHYPLQSDVFRNSLPDRTVTITKLEFNPSFAADDFAISAEVQVPFMARVHKTLDDRTPGGNPEEIAAGIVFIRGSWNTTLVRQNDGIVVLEAPISSGYSAKVIQMAQSRFPGLPIKAVVSTSDSWPHIGGVREYVAHGVPVYVLDRTVPLIKRFLRAPRTQNPDDLARVARPAKLRSISGKTVIGEGANRMEIYPIHGETSERQMMVYFPEHKLLLRKRPLPAA